MKCLEGPGHVHFWIQVKFNDTDPRNLTKMMKRIKELFYTSSN